MYNNKNFMSSLNLSETKLSEFINKEDINSDVSKKVYYEKVIDLYMDQIFNVDNEFLKSLIDFDDLKYTKDELDYIIYEEMGVNRNNKKDLSLILNRVYESYKESKSDKNYYLMKYLLPFTLYNDRIFNKNFYLHFGANRFFKNEFIDAITDTFMYIRDNNIECEVIELLFNDILTKLYVHSNEVVSRILVRIAKKDSSLLFTNDTIFNILYSLYSHQTIKKIKRNISIESIEKIIKMNRYTYIERIEKAIGRQLSFYDNPNGKEIKNMIKEFKNNK
ncbi:hypothetical protein UFVDC4_00202 [Staphylococcus phage vB_SauM-UFV_DC4]|nr:hypothetical protein UFVDC4_00202 [Staphylococcus phage vB_SauM-UFV_DC4]